MPNYIIANLQSRVINDFNNEQEAVLEVVQNRFFTASIGL